MECPAPGDGRRQGRHGHEFLGRCPKAVLLESSPPPQRHRAPRGDAETRSSRNLGVLRASAVCIDWEQHTTGHYEFLQNQRSG